HRRDPRHRPCRAALLRPAPACRRTRTRAEPSDPGRPDQAANAGARARRTMKKLIRRIVTLAIIGGLGVGLYFFGNKYLWPPPDDSMIQAVGMLEAPEVNITS